MGVQKDKNSERLQQVIMFETVGGQPTRGQKQQFEIVMATVKLLAFGGTEAATYTKIAKECGVARTLINNYFPKSQDLFTKVILFVRSTFQRLIINEMENAGPLPKDRLRAYLSGCFRWLIEYPTHYKVYLFFFYQCGIEPSLRALNTELVDVGHDRIQAILEDGNSVENWSVADTYTIAKEIQILVTGALITLMTENSRFKARALEKMTISTAHLLIKTNLDLLKDSKN